MSSFDPERLKKVLDLEKTRVDRDYKEGWLYFKAKERGLYQEYVYLKDNDLLGRKKEDLKGREAASNRLIPGGTFELLTLEFIPENTYKKNFRNEIGKYAWKRFQRLTFMRAGNTCQTCPATPPKGGLHCHEMWEFDEKTGTQHLVHLVALCKECHNAKHINFVIQRGWGEREKTHFKKVTGKTDEEFNRYLGEQLIILKRREGIDWKPNYERGYAVGFAKEKKLTTQETQATSKVSYPKRIEQVIHSLPKVLPSFHIENPPTLFTFRFFLSAIIVGIVIGSTLKFNAIIVLLKKLLQVY